MSESLDVTVVLEDGGDGWIMATVPEVPGAISQGRTPEEARANVLDALNLLLEVRSGESVASAEQNDGHVRVTIGA
jgi:predicted RNase H-like HicB family nuclease